MAQSAICLSCTVFQALSNGVIFINFGALVKEKSKLEKKCISCSLVNYFVKHGHFAIDFPLEFPGHLILNLQVNSLENCAVQVYFENGLGYFNLYLFQSA